MDIDKRPLIKPPRLRPGDTIGIVAPASPFDTAAFRSGIAALEAMGFSVVVPDDLFEKDGYLAGSDAHRADLINRLFADRTIKAILCARGGFGSIRLLSMLDYDAIDKNPKIFAGFSDISALLTAIYLKCGLVTFHAPVLTMLGRATNRTRDALLRAFTSDAPLETMPRQAIVIKPGSASGPVAGGNLTTLCHLLGTPFEPGFKGHILLLEDRGEDGYRIDRMLSQMKLAGCFEGLAGLVLGSFEDCGEPGVIFRIVEDIFNEADVPILAGFDIGHGETNVTIPLGLDATLDTDRQVLRFHESATV
jgi:muramoyltetrapeptide carboxypeptidase